MRHRRFKQAALLGGTSCLLLSAAQVLAVVPPAPLNGVVVEPRVTNQYPLSAETVKVDAGPAVPTPLPTPAGDISVPGAGHTITISDTGMAPAGQGVNRTDVLMSIDGGATAWQGNITQGFTFSATFNLTDGTDSPRKETGIRINGGSTGDAEFIINSDAGEIVAFGGGAPFFNFRPAIEPQYLTGQTITLTEIYTPAVGVSSFPANPGTLEYKAQLAGGQLFDSGPLNFSDNEGGPGGSNTFTVGAYVQYAPSSGLDSVTDVISNFSGSTTPEPGSLTLLGIGGVALLTRRRAKTA